MDDDGQKIESRVRRTTRIRGPIHGKRRLVTVRMEPELHERMMGLCDDLHIAANTYIINLIEDNLRRRKKQ